MILEKGAPDEILVLQTLKIQVDIANLIEHICNNYVLFQTLRCTTGRLLTLNRTDHIDAKTLFKMTNARINQPVLIAEINGGEWLIDGNHRPMKRRELAMKETSYIFISIDELRPFLSEFSLI